MEVEIIKNILKQYNVLDCKENIKKFLRPFDKNDIYFSDDVILYDGIKECKSKFLYIEETDRLIIKYGQNCDFIFNKQLNVSIMELQIIIKSIYEKYKQLHCQVINEFLDILHTEECEIDYLDLLDYDTKIHIQYTRKLFKSCFQI